MLSASLALPATAFAQIDRLPVSVQRALAGAGPRWRAENRALIPQMFELFRPLLAAASRDDARVERDVVYGAHALQRIDVYRPARSTPAAPIVVFFHGGGLTSGDKNVNAEIYANVGYYFTRHGFVALNANYRLAPAATFPAGALDVGAVVAWAYDHAAALGGDPRRIVLVGHSSGGTHVASWAYDRAIHGAGGPRVAGVVLLSGRLEADSRPDDPNAAGVVAYFGPDARAYRERSPATHGATSPLPTLVVIAQYDNPFLDVYGARFFAARCAAAGRCPRFAQLDGHNHISMVASLDTADDRLGALIRSFIAEDVHPAGE